MKRIRIRPGKVVYVSDEIAKKAADALRRVSLTKEEVQDIVRTEPRKMPLVMVGARLRKLSLRRPASTAKVLAKVRRILEESGNPSLMSPSDMERWVDVWMQTRQPALHGKTPAEAIQLLDGWGQVESLLEQVRDGGFS